MLLLAFRRKFSANRKFCLEKFNFRVKRSRSLKRAEKFPPTSQSNVREPGENPGRLRHCNGYKFPMPPTQVGKAGVRFEAEVRIPV
jgi:hypothetical protein